MNEADAAIVLNLPAPEATAALGQALGRLCRAGDVLALEGELGAGKTSLVRGIAAGLGVDVAAVSSPTFVRMVEHEPAPDAQGPWLVHVDAYRMGGPEELEEMGWGPDLLGESVVAVEWASRVRAALPDDLLDVELSHAAGGGRTLRLTGVGAWAERLARGAAALRAAAATP